MVELKGKYTTAKIFAETVEQEVISQVYDLLNHPMFEGEKVRVMADTHAGKGCVVGLTTTTNDIMIPNIIGVDIGCGMLTVALGSNPIDLEALDDFIYKKLPSGFNVNERAKTNHTHKSLLKEVKRISELTGTEYYRHHLSLGSLGGGNHFIEIAKDSIGLQYLVIHSGSRNFGLQICKYHQKKAVEYRELKGHKIPKTLAFLEGQQAQDYIRDMKVGTEFASVNRNIMADRILDFLGLKSDSRFETIHNYYDGEIIRKGSISAKDSEPVLIPINMRDGSILAVGKGNEDYNNSAPHGAGRVMSRSKAKATLDFEEFQESMSDIYTNSVHRSTLDEAPRTYKPMDEIIRNISDTVEVVDILKPIYNFKAH